MTNLQPTSCLRHQQPSTQRLLQVAACCPRIIDLPTSHDGVISVRMNTLMDFCLSESSEGLTESRPITRLRSDGQSPRMSNEGPTAILFKVVQNAVQRSIGLLNGRR